MTSSSAKLAPYVACDSVTEASQYKPNGGNTNAIFFNCCPSAVCIVQGILMITGVDCLPRMRTSLPDAKPVISVFQ